MAYLIKLLGARPQRLRVELGEAISIGRSPETDICLDDKLVSRRHCELRAVETGLLVRDLGSRNGVCLNGQRLDGEALAHPGDQVRVGSHFLLVGRPGEEHEGEHASGAATPTASSGRRARAERASGAPPRRPSLPGYELVEELGRGHVGRVFRARSLVDARDVAVKVLDPSATEQAVRRFERSAGALRRLDHPNIVKVYEVGRIGDTHFLTMEYLEGTTLARMIRKQPVGVREALAIGVQVARALRLAHELEVVHRDVSPENVLVLKGGVVKLLGFSFAKSVDPGEGGDQASLTNLGEIVGELVYSSPEQARDPRTVDHRSDLYALGAVLYHAIAGQPPFRGANHLEVLRLVLGAAPRPLREVAPRPGAASADAGGGAGGLDTAPAAGVPEGVSALVDRLLEKDPARRPASAAEVERALEDALLEVCGGERDRDDDDARSFGGGFSGAELLEIAQFLELHQKSGRLVVSAGPLEGELLLHDGLIIQAAAGQLAGEPAAMALLEAPEGTFRFQGSRDEGSYGPPSSALLLKPSVLAIEVLRGRDEKRRAR